MLKWTDSWFMCRAGTSIYPFEQRLSFQQHANCAGTSVTNPDVHYVLQFLFKFLSSTNSLSHLDLSDTSCPLDTVSERCSVLLTGHVTVVTHWSVVCQAHNTHCDFLLQLFVSLSAGCCFKLMHLNLARNPFSHRSAPLEPGPGWMWYPLCIIETQRGQHNFPDKTHNNYPGAATDLICERASCHDPLKLNGMICV